MSVWNFYEDHGKIMGVIMVRSWVCSSVCHLSSIVLFRGRVAAPDEVG